MCGSDRRASGVVPLFRCLSRPISRLISRTASRHARPRSRRELLPSRLTRKPSEALRSPQKPSEALRSPQKPSELNSGRRRERSLALLLRLLEARRRELDAKALVLLIANEEEEGPRAEAHPRGEEALAEIRRSSGGDQAELRRRSSRDRGERSWGEIVGRGRAEIAPGRGRRGHVCARCARGTRRRSRRPPCSS